MTRTLADASVAVIGASGGLGTPVSKLLHERGAKLILAGPHPEKLAAVDIPDAVVVEADLRDPECGDRIARAAKERHSRLDGVVNVAGVVAFGPLIDTADEIIEELFLVNVLGPLWAMKRLAPLLADSSGFVLNVSAVVAEQPLPQMAPYAASKAALTAADRALAREFRRLGVRVCDVRPPHTETGLATRPIAGAAPPLPPGLSPDEVAMRIVAAIEAEVFEVPAADFG
jgi:NAD(P)-dependent dehydrogenase (short-subunit alcohol dehydrogenase family)